jgi:hypothetical protein
MATGVHGGKYAEWLQQMIDLGLVPPETCRIIIDAGIDGPIRVFYECLADERMFNIELVDAMKGADVISVNEKVDP